MRRTSLRSGHLVVLLLFLAPLGALLLLRSTVDPSLRLRTDPEAAERAAAAAFSGNGALVAFGLDDGHLLIRQTARGVKLERFRLAAHRSDVLSVALDAAGHQALTTGRDAQARLWHLAPADLVLTLGRHRSQRWGLAFSPDGTLAAVGGYEPNITLWRTADAAQVGALRGYAFWFDRLAFSPDGRHLASASDGNSAVAIWRVADLLDDATASESLQADRYLIGHREGLRALAWAADGTRLATGGSGDQTIRVWDLDWETPDTRLGIELHRFGELSSRPVALAFAPDGARLAAALEDGSVLLWETREPAAPATLLGATAAPPLALAWETSDAVLVADSRRGLLRFATTPRVD